MAWQRARVAAAATTNSTLVQGVKTNLYSIVFTNTSAADKFVKFYDKATAPTVGTDTPVFTICVEANNNIVAEWPAGLNFEAGLGYGITGAVADSDTTAVTANDVHGVIAYA